MKLRAINLNDVAGARLSAAFDVPAFSRDDDLTIVFGIVRDEHLCIGTPRRWEERLSRMDPRFTYSRQSTQAGAMYYRDVGLFRAWVSEEMISPRDLQVALLRAAISLVQAHAPSAGEMSIGGHYAWLERKKFAGISANLINGRSNCVLCINKDPVDFEALRPLFYTKRFDTVGDLSALGIPDSAYPEMVEWLARAFHLPLEWSSFTAEELETLARLEVVHASKAWLLRAERDDLDCLSFYLR